MATWKIYERENPVKHFVTADLSDEAAHQLVAVLKEHGAFADPVLEDADETRLILAKEDVHRGEIEWES